MRTLGIALALVLGGCSSFRTNSRETNYKLNQPMAATTGSTMVFVADKTFDGSTLSGQRMDLLYLGFAGIDPVGKENIRVRYQEFYSDERGDFVKPAFGTEVNFDMSKSPLIAYKEWLINVVEATGSEIKYVVIEGPLPGVAVIKYGNAWLGLACDSDEDCRERLSCRPVRDQPDKKQCTPSSR